MRQKLLTLLTSLTMVLVPTLSLASPVYAVAPSCGSSTTAKGQVLQSIGQTGNNCDDQGVNNAIKAIVQILSIIVGIAAIIAIIVSGLRYITSGGEAGKVSAAKSALMYALIGVAIAALAQVLVHFVLFQTYKRTH
jgi:uncharacterized membrane protein YuzA (DUF378 family)